MQICLIEPFFTGSHQRWATELQRASQHEIELLSLPGRHWKWRMHAAAITLADQFLTNQQSADLILATDMLDLSLFCALTKRRTANIPAVLYFHENQLTYPWSPADEDVLLKRDNHYAFINYTSALVADRICFNSHYHQRSFLDALPAFLRQFPDYTGLEMIESIRAKSSVLPLGLQLKELSGSEKKAIDNEPVILWNHRWEYDKDPDLFFQSLMRLKQEGIAFKLVVLGEGYKKSPPVFDYARAELSEEILHWGYTHSREEYEQWLWRSNILPVTSRQDFFGGSVVEAIYCGCFPLLPRRLAYPEHIPELLHSTYLYDSDENYYARLKAIIENKLYLRHSNDLQNFASRYDWSTLAPRYDHFFASIN